MKKILSIDGGGIRGILPALILDRIEQDCGRPVSSMFDLMAGTSTGGILAAGLAVPHPSSPGMPRYRAREIADLYEKRGREIFPPWIRTFPGANVFDERYPADGLERVLRDTFGEVRMSEVLCPILAAAYEIETRQPFFFKSEHVRRQTGAVRYDDFLLRDLARATSAAPTYFEPVKLGSEDRENRQGYVALIDGGVFANNPALCAWVEARTLFPDEEDFLLVSLGTGELTRPFPYERARNWGLIDWGTKIFDLCSDGLSDTVDYQMRQLTAGAPGRYHRFQVALTKGYDEMDNASVTNVSALKDLARKILRERKDDLAALCKILQ